MNERRECPYCDNDYKQLERHVKSQHPQERWPPVVFANENPCDNCGSSPTRVFYGETRADDLWLCEECEKKKYCEECHETFKTERGAKIHAAQVHGRRFEEGD